MSFVVSPSKFSPRMIVTNFSVSVREPDISNGLGLVKGAAHAKLLSVAQIRR